MFKNILIKSIIKYKILVYDMVEINVGYGYDVNFGKFMVLESGIYVFYIIMIFYDRFYSLIEVVKNGKVKDVVWVDFMSYDDRVVVFIMIVLNLMKGDIVLIRVGEVYVGNYLESN